MTKQNKPVQVYDGSGYKSTEDRLDNIHQRLKDLNIELVDLEAQKAAEDLAKPAGTHLDIFCATAQKINDNTLRIASPSKPSSEALWGIIRDKSLPRRMSIHVHDEDGIYKIDNQVIEKIIRHVQRVGEELFDVVVEQ